MKAVFLDLGTMDAAELDPSPLADVVLDFTAFDSTPAALVPERIDGVRSMAIHGWTTPAKTSF